MPASVPSPGADAALALRLLVRAFLRLDPLPQVLDRMRGKPLRVTEHVRMTPQQLLGDRLDHVAEVESTLLLRHARMENHLQQEVAQFLTQIVELAACHRIGDLIGLLDGVGSDGRKILLQVPWTTGAGRAQRRHDRKQPADIAGREHGGPEVRRRTTEHR